MAIKGYKYYMGIHMGLCRGPIDSLLEVRVGDRTVFPLPYHESGSTALPVAPTSSTTITLNAPEVFGGDDKEGGIVGSLDVMMGEDTQAVNEGLASMLGNDLVSAFRGMVTLFYNGLVATLNPYPKPWKFRVARTSKGWDGAVFLIEQAAIPLFVSQPIGAGGPAVSHLIKAMNPAHIIWECLTNRDWGRGLSSTLLDEPSFILASNALTSEGFGLCLKWTREDTIEAFVQSILDHIGAVLFVSRTTGLLNLELLRDNYIVADLPTYTTSTGILTIEEDNTSTRQMAVNEVVVKFIDPLSGLERQIRVQNIASVQASGATLSKVMEYPGIPTAALAARVAQRDLRVNSAQLRRFKLIFNRAAYTLHPGSVFVLNDPLRSIASMVLRVGKVDDTPDGNIVVVAVQDVFGLSATSFITPVGAGGSGGAAPIDPPYTSVVEASYLDIRRNSTPAEFLAIPPESTFLMMLGARPVSNSLTYSMYTGSVSLGFSIKGVAGWTPAGLMLNTLTRYADTIALGNLTLPSSIVAGLGVLVDGEYMRIVTYDPVTNFITVHRGCADTIPEHHASLSPVFFFLSGTGNDQTVYVEGETVAAKFLTNTPTASLAEGSAAAHSVTFAGRFIRPYPPAGVAIDSVLFYDAAPVDVDFSLTWANRNRVSQFNVLVAHNDSNITPEVGQTNEVIISDYTGVVRTVTGVTGTSWGYDSSMWATDGSPSVFQIEFYSIRDSHKSWKKYARQLSFDAASATAHVYWRLNISEPHIPIGGLSGVAGVYLSEVEMRATVGGVNQCVGGTPTASSEHIASAGVATVFNGLKTSNEIYWISETMDVGDPDEWVAYEFATAVIVKEVEITIVDPLAPTMNVEYPKDFQVQYSDDGTTWVNAFFVLNAPLADWESLGRKTYSLTSVR